MSTKAIREPARGTRDFLPVDMWRRQHVIGVIREVYERYGFAPLETPSFERLETLLGKYGEEGDQLVFKILFRGEPLVDGIRRASEHLAKPGVLVKGRSGEVAPSAEVLLSDLGLRYDLTVPLARVVAAYVGKLPAVFRRYQIQPVWRADSPGKGRFREFYQCDVDVVGSTSRVVEAEVISAVVECLERLGFREFHVRLNHRALLTAVVEHAGVPAGLEGPAIVAIDKLDKLSPEAVSAELREKGVPDEAARRLVALVTSASDLDRLAAELTSARGAAAIADLREVLGLAALTKAGPRLRFDLSLARGLGYYTGAIFEVAAPDLAGSLGGGGRYDGLVGMFLGKPVPACGFSLGLERILVVMEERGLFPPDLGRVDVLVGATDPAALGPALALAGELRGRGRKVELLAGPEKPGKIRKSADERAIPVAVWLGAAGQVEGVWVAEPLAAQLGPVVGSAEGLAGLLDKWDSLKPQG